MKKFKQIKQYVSALKEIAEKPFLVGCAIALYFYSTNTTDITLQHVERILAVAFFICGFLPLVTTFAWVKWPK